jgi:hypothetical protein
MDLLDNFLSLLEAFSGIVSNPMTLLIGVITENSGSTERKVNHGPATADQLTDRGGRLEQSL